MAFMKERFKNISISTALPYVGLAVVLLSFKFTLIALYGNATPFWDQWDLEADTLYRPWINGSLVWSDLFSPHCEHRMFTTRVLALLLFEINGRVWHPILQMQVNAVLHVLALCVFLFYSGKLLTGKYKTAFFVFCTALFCMPFSWENILFGIQSQPYLFLLFSFIFLWAMVNCKPLSLKWWGGFLFGLLCMLTQAAGAITVLAGALIVALRQVEEKENKIVVVSAVALLAMVATIAVVFTPDIPSHAHLKAKSVSQFLRTLITLFSWPESKIGIGAFVIQIPLLVFMFKVLRRSDYRTSAHLFIFAIGLWLIGQFVLLSYGRALDVTASRYRDIFAIGTAINFATLLILFGDVKNKLKMGAAAVIVVWLVTVTAGIAMSTGKIYGEILLKWEQSLEQEKNICAYLCTGDGGHLRNKPFLHVPYPNPDRLQRLLDNPTIRSFLPRNICGPGLAKVDEKIICDPEHIYRYIAE
jgi:hypothetical protein